MFEGQNIVVFDLEVEHSPDDLPTGWRDKRALGYAVGVAYDYAVGKDLVVEKGNLADHVESWVGRAPLLVSFNGISFDFALIRAVLREDPGRLELCGCFKRLCAVSYDILAELWRASPDTQFTSGLNKLDAVLAANGLPPKTGDGALAPKLWQAGRQGEVIQYCKDDVERTRLLFELICATKGRIRRADGELWMRYVDDNCRIVAPAGSP